MAPHPRHWIVRTGRSGQLRRHRFGPSRARERWSFNISYVLITLPIAAAVIFATVTKRDGESLAAITICGGRRASSPAIRRCGPGPSSRNSAPGPAQSRWLKMWLISVHDNLAGSYGLVWDQRTGFLSATLKCAALSTWLVDANVGDGWVANWARLAGQPGLRTDDRLGVGDGRTRPPSRVDAGPSRVQPDVPRRARARPPHHGRARPHRPGMAADIQTRVTITFDPAASSEPLDTLADQAAEGLRTAGRHAVRSAGLTASAPSPAPRTTSSPASCAPPSIPKPGARCRASSAPPRPVHGPPPRPSTLARGRPDRARGALAPVPARLRVSVVWGWHEAPRQRVTSNVLARLMSPGRFPRRVTLIYRPFSSAHAAHHLEDQVNAAKPRSGAQAAGP